MQTAESRRSAAFAPLVDDRRGGAIVLAALALPILIGLTGLAIDVSVWRNQKKQIQTAADAAAFSGAVQLLRRGDDNARVMQITKNDAERNGASAAQGDSVDVNVDGAARSVEVQIERPAPLLFSAPFVRETPTLRARALAKATDGLRVCILALDSSASPAISVEGSSKVNALDCVVYANSTAGQAIWLNSAAHMTAQLICAVGGTSGGNFTPPPETGCSPLSDPLLDLPSPPTSACTETNYQAPKGNTRLSPGVYCNGLSAKSGAKVTLDPGTFVIKGGALKFGGNTSLSGTGVTLVLTEGAIIDFSGGPDLALSAPIDGEYAGIAIYIDRSQPELSHKMQGSVGARIDGTLYAPTGHMIYAGSAAAAITVAIARRFTFSGSSSFQRDTTATTVPLPTGFAGSGLDAKVALTE